MVTDYTYVRWQSLWSINETPTYISVVIVKSYFVEEMYVNVSYESVIVYCPYTTVRTEGLRVEVIARDDVDWRMNDMLAR